MDKPPPYEPQPLVSCQTATNTTPEFSASSTPTFHIRQTTRNDAPSTLRLHEHLIANSPRSTSKTTASLSEIKYSIMGPISQNLVQAVQIVAVPIAQPNTGSSISSLVRKFANYTIDRSPQKPSSNKRKLVDITNGIGILGYAILLPYTDGMKGPTKCYNRTASLHIFSIEEKVIGEEMYWNVNRGLIEEALDRIREQGYRYKTVLTSTPFSDEEPALVRWREVLIDRGFVQVACLKGVLEKWGKVMDMIYLQKDLEVEAVGDVGEMGGKGNGKE